MQGNKPKQSSDRSVARIRAFLNSLLITIHFRKNSRMLSYTVDLIKKKYKKPESKFSSIKRWYHKITHWIFSDYRGGAFFVLLVLIILWFLPLHQWLGSVNLNLADLLPPDFFLSLWEVQAAMIGITFVVIMFLVGTLIEKIKETDEKVSERIIRELVIASKIYIVLAFCLFSIVYIGVTIFLQVSGQAYQNLILFILNIAAIFYLFRACFTFFRLRSFEKLRLLQLKDELNKNINQEIDHRIALFILMKLEGKLRYSPLGAFDYSLIQAISNPTTKPKIVRDINLEKLRHFSQTTPIEIYKNIGDALTKSNDVLCSVPKGTSSELIEKIRECFVLSELSEDIELSDTLDGVQEEMREAIRISNVTKLERVLDVYFELLESFLEQTTSFGIHFISTTARSEPLFEWKPAFRIVRSFEQAIEYAFKQEDTETLEQVVYFIKRVFSLSLQYNDHFLINNFSLVLVFVYDLGSRTRNSRIANIAIDRSWRYLSEMSLHCSFLLKKTDDIEKVHNLRDYVIEIILTFNRLLKAAIDNRDVKSFKKFGAGLDGLLEHLQPMNSSFQLRMRIGDPSLSQEEKEQLNRQLELEKELESIKQRIETIRDFIWFGLGGWITRLNRDQKMGSDKFFEFLYEISSRFGTLEKLSSTYGQLGISEEENFGWSFWDIENEEEGKVVMGIGSHEWMQWFYCVQGILLSPVALDAGVSIVPSRVIASDIEAITRICSEIAASPMKWVVTDSQIKERASTFLLLNQQAVAAQTKNEEKWLIEQQLSEQKCEDFQKETVAFYEKSGNVRRIIEKLGKYADYDNSDSKCQSIQVVGLNRLLDKAEFVEGWHVAYVGMEREFGRALGTGENKRLLGKICDSFELKHKCKKEEICQALRSAIVKLSELKIAPNVIFVRDWKTYKIIRKSEKFVPKDMGRQEEIDIVDLFGRFEGIPVVLVRECPVDCCILDIAAVGVLNRCKITSEEPYLKISIETVDNNLAKEIIKRNPAFLKDQSGKDRKPEDVIAELQLKVRVIVMSKKEFELQNKNAGIIIEFVDH